MVGNGCVSSGQLYICNAVSDAYQRKCLVYIAFRAAVGSLTVIDQGGKSELQQKIITYLRCKLCQSFDSNNMESMMASRIVMRPRYSSGL